MKRLWLSSIPEDFDPKKDIPLGLWCFFGKEHIYPKFEDFDFEPDPFKSVEEIAQYAKVTTDFANTYIYELSNLLNQINGTNYTIKFWRLMVFPWLLTLVQSTWERQLRINQFIRKYKDHEIEITLVKSNIGLNFNDTYDFIINGVLNNQYNAWLYSRILEKQIPSNWEVNWIELGKKKNVSYSRKSSKIKFKDLLSPWFMSKSVEGIGILESALLELLLFFKSPLHFEHNHLNISHSANINLNWDLSWSHLVNSTIPDVFRNLSKIDEDLPSFKRRRYYLIGPITWYNEKLKLILAQSIDHGSKIIGTQHGSNYGNLKVHSLAASIEYNHFRFLSWGWTNHGEYYRNIQAMPSPLLSKFKYKRKNKELIFVGIGLPLFNYRFDSTPNTNSIIKYRKEKIVFINNLSSRPYENLLYRYDPRGRCCLNDREYVQEFFQDIRIFSGVNIHKRIMNCRLLVLDNPGTTLSIALSSNIPTICFWDKNAWIMCPQAEPYFDELRKVGILFNSGEEAAQKVNEIWDCVQYWWENSDIQKARKEWVWQYARTSKHWLWEWLKILWKL